MYLEAELIINIKHCPSSDIVFYSLDALSLILDTLSLSHCAIVFFVFISTRTTDSLDDSSPHRHVVTLQTTFSLRDLTILSLSYLKSKHILLSFSLPPSQLHCITKRNFHCSTRQQVHSLTCLVCVTALSFFSFLLLILLLLRLLHVRYLAAPLPASRSFST